MRRQQRSPERLTLAWAGTAWAHWHRLGFVAAVLLTLALPAQSQVLLEFAVFEDPAGTETIQSVAEGDPRRFRPLAGPSFAGGYTRSTHWFRVIVDAPEGEWWLEILPPILDDVRLYSPDLRHPEGFLERWQGDRLPFTSREINYRGFVFRMPEAAPGPQTLYLRVSSTSSSMVLMRFATPANFMTRATLEYGFLFASITIVLIVMLIHFNSSWFSLHDPLTPWFLAYLSVLMMVIAGNAGLLHQYIYPGSGLANNWVVSFVSLMAISTFNRFYGRFFGIDRNQPVLYWIYELGFWLPFAGLLLSLLGFYIEVMYLLTATLVPLVLLNSVLALRMWTRGMPGGAMMLLANLLSLMGISAFTLFLRGYVAGETVMLHSLQISSLGSSVALALAVGARYQALHEARLHAEREAHHEREMRTQQSQFLTMLTHELRNALSVLRMALGRQPMSPNALASAERAVHGMSEVIDRCLQADTLLERRTPIETTPVLVNEMLAAIVADSRNPGRIRVVLESQPRLQTDAKLLHVILANLIDNALKYGDPEAPIEVVVSGEQPCRIRVLNGIGSFGFPDPFQIFEKYYRGPLAHGVTGSGLGLHIAKSMAELLGGSLECTRLEGDRVGFELCL